MTVAVLDCSDDNVAYENFSRVMSDTRLFDVHELEFPENPDAVLVTGSRHGVYEDKEWIPPLLEKIRDYAEQEIPILGVCFGHQAVAKALGGDVECMGEYEIGYEPVKLEEGDLLEGLDEIEYPFSSHQDEVVSLPDEVEETAENSVSTHGYQHIEKPIFGIQFHPEFDTETIKQLIKKKDISDERKQKLLDQVTEDNQERAERTQIILKRFKKLSEA